MLRQLSSLTFQKLSSFFRASVTDPQDVVPVRAYITTHTATAVVTAL